MNRARRYVFDMLLGGFEKGGRNVDVLESRATNGSCRTKESVSVKTTILKIAIAVTLA